MSAFRTFSNTSPNISSSTYTSCKKGAEIFKFTSNQAKNYETIKKTGDFNVNSKTKCLQSTNNYENLLLITKGRYLADPRLEEMNLGDGDIHLGNYLFMEYDGLISTKSTQLETLHPGTSIADNTIAYPPPVVLNDIFPPPLNENYEIKYNDNVIPPNYQTSSLYYNQWKGTNIVDPCYNIFYNANNDYTEGSTNCNAYQSLAYLQHVDISGEDLYNFKHIQKKNILNGFSYPRNIVFTCNDNNLINNEPKNSSTNKASKGMQSRKKTTPPKK